MQTAVAMTEDEFIDLFKPVANHIDLNASFGGYAYGTDKGAMFETFGPELEFVQQSDQALVWTILDCDGDIYIVAGAHHVNRMGYLIASIARTPDQDNIEIFCD